MTDRAKAIAAILAIEATEPPEMGGSVFRGMGLSDWEAGVIADTVLAAVGRQLVATGARRERAAIVEYTRRLRLDGAFYRVSFEMDNYAARIERGEHLKGGEL